MSKLSDLRSKGETVTLSNGLELELFPMTLDEEAEVGEMAEKGLHSKAMVYLVKQAIKTALPDATDEEVNSLNKEDLKTISEAVMKVNRLTGDETKKSSTNSA